jgi:hypothetical protein
MKPITFTNPATKYHWFNTLWLLLLLAVPLVLWLLPSVTFDDTGFELCPIKAVSGYDCPGCGMTRAVMHMHHGEWETAMDFNYGIAFIYPGLIYFWFLWIFKAYKRHMKFMAKRKTTQQLMS